MGVPTAGTVPVLGSWMHYQEAGEGPPVVLLHGNPTSSWLWRHVLRRAAADAGGGHRWIAPDLIGMGGSGKPELEYRLRDHIAFVDGFLDALDLRDVVLVGHDWGVAIVVDRLRRHPEAVRAVAVMEGHLRPLVGWSDLDEGGRALFQDLRTAGVGERMVVEEDVFLRTLLPGGLVRPVDDADLAVYRSPYAVPESRRPLLAWAREIPIGGEPADVAAMFAAGVECLRRVDTPTLLVHGRPGVLVTADTVDWCRANVRRLSVVDVGGPAGHFLPEDRPDQVADALIDWVRDLP